MSFKIDRKNICLKVTVSYSGDNGSIKLKKLPLQSCRNYTSEELLNITNKNSEFIIYCSERNPGSEHLFYVEIVALSDASVMLTNNMSYEGLWSGYLQAKGYMIQSLNTAIKQGHIFLSPAICNGELEVLVVLSPSAFQSFTQPDEKFYATLNTKSKMIGTLKPIFQLLFLLKDDIIQSSSQSCMKLNGIMELYDYIKNHNLKSNTVLEYKNFQHPDLLPILRKYQVEAVSWMISKENKDFYETGNQNDLHPLWQEIVCADQSKIYFNPYNGGLTKQRFGQDVLPKGGILAEEMGLGKTVEVLACILNNQCPIKYSYDSAKSINKEENSFDIVRNNNTKKCNINVEVATSDTENVISDGIFMSSKNDSWLPSPVKKMKCHKILFGEVENNQTLNLNKNYLSLESTVCDICGYTNNYELVSIKVKCEECNSIMHKKCSGYMDLNVIGYLCPTCAIKQVIETHCTLIVCPDTLITQWVLEIDKHVKKNSLKYMVYKGVKHHQFLQPKFLAKYDIILTSFSTLRLDFNYVIADNANRSLRHKKKYVILPCPLIGLKFWRVCIDEAQMVECKGTKLVEMSLRISALHRWCVTGTPVQKRIEDIYGLLMFLCVKPYGSQVWWKRALYDYYRAGDHQKLFNLVALVTWRNSKVHVDSQLGIPKMTEFLTTLHFSAIEHNFYFKEHEKCQRKIDSKTGLKELNQSVKLSDLVHESVNQILSIMLPLRQACCHPSVVRNNIFFFEKNNITMDKLVKKLTSDAKVESEEAHRKLICAINGIAGVEVLMDNISAAIEFYEQAISSWKKHSDLHTDSLQKLHTLFNLHEILVSFKSSKYNEQSLIEMLREIEDMRFKYLTPIRNDIEASKKELDQVKIDINEKKDKIDFENPWWVQLLIYANQNCFYDNFMAKVTDELLAHEASSSLSICGKFSSLSSLMHIVQKNIEQLELTRKEIYIELNNIVKFPEVSCIREAADCCLRGSRSVGLGSCNFCQFEKKLSLYELMLFSQHCFQTREVETKASGLRLETEMDWLFKLFLSCGKMFGLPTIILDQGKEHIKYIDAIKKEFKCLRTQFLFHHRQLQLLDELDMCTMRVRLKQNSEKTGNSYIIDGEELNKTKLSFESDRTAALNELAKKKGQLLYLQNLASVQTDHDGYNQECCPICVNQLGVQWAVFNCGHCICCQCLVELQKQSSVLFHTRRQIIKCPICRTPNHQVSIVVTKQKKPDSFDSHVTFKGSYSTKIAAIVRRVLWIHEQDSSSKVLVFSTWYVVLHLISLALRENGIKFHILQGGNNKFQVFLQEFKQSSIVNVLLLPLQAGSKGLNIIEATHVILVEPVLNLGEELQAVGRIHRIGQTRSTFVHRFIICGSIEEKIAEFFKDKQHVSHVEPQTLMTLADITSLIA